MVTERLLDAIYDPTITMSGGPRASPLQIMHFVCHKETETERASDFASFSALT